MEEKLELVEELVEVDQGKKLDEITMAVFGEIANSVDEDANGSQQQSRLSVLQEANDQQTHHDGKLGSF